MRWTSRLLADPAALRCAAFAPASLSALKFGKVELFDHRRSLHYPPSGQRPRASPGGAGVSPVPMPLSWHAGSPNGLVPALEHNTADRAQQPGRKCAHMAERLVFLVSPSTLDGGAAQWMELAYADAFNVRTFVLLHHLRFHELKAREAGVPPLLLASQCNQAIQWKEIVGDLRSLAKEASQPSPTRFFFRMRRRSQLRRSAEAADQRAAAEACAGAGCLRCACARHGRRLPDGDKGRHGHCQRRCHRRFASGRSFPVGKLRSRSRRCLGQGRRWPQAQDAVAAAWVAVHAVGTARRRG